MEGLAVAAEVAPPPLEPQPHVAAVVQQLMSDMGVQGWEPRVVDALVDFLHQYVGDTLQDAQSYGEHAGKLVGEVGLDDVMLAIQARTAFTFTQPPDQDEIAALASVVNDKDMPRFPTHKFGLLIPDDALTAQDYQLAVDPKQEQQH